MAVITKPKTFTAGTKIVAADVNSDFDTIYNDYNGNITNANIAASAAIVDTKLATISTGGKVNVSALTATSQAAGDICYADSSSSYARLAKGTANQVLHMNAGATAPEWVSLATGAEVLTGTDATKPVVPSTMVSHQGVIKGWIKFVGTGTIAISDSYNVSGITDNGTGDYTVTWDTDFANANYAVVGMVEGTNGLNNVYIKASGQAVGAVNVITRGQNGTTTYTDDENAVHLIAIGGR